MPELRSVKQRSADYVIIRARKKPVLVSRMFLRSMEDSAYNEVIGGKNRRRGRVDPVEQILVCLTFVRASWDLVGKPNLFVFPIQRTMALWEIRLN